MEMVSNEQEVAILGNDDSAVEEGCDELVHDEIVAVLVDPIGFGADSLVAPPRKDRALRAKVLAAAMSAGVLLGACTSSGEESDIANPDQETTSSSLPMRQDTSSETQPEQQVSPEILDASLPSLRVEGNTLIDQNTGKEFRVEGVTRIGTEYACAQGWGIFYGPAHDAEIKAMKQWGFNTVRVPLNSQCWLGDDQVGGETEFTGAAYRQAIITYVDRLNEAGMVAQLDLHWSNDPEIGPALGQAPMADVTSLQMWAELAAAVKDKEVILEAFNEPYINITTTDDRTVGGELLPPTAEDWDCWLNGCELEGGFRAVGMQSILDTIRAVNPDAPVGINGLRHANDLRGVQLPVDPSNNMLVGVHIYDFNDRNTEAELNEMLDPIAAQYPIIVSEFGSEDCSGDFNAKILSWISSDQRNYSFNAFGWHPSLGCEGPGLIDSWDGTPSTQGDDVLAFMNPDSSLLEKQREESTSTINGESTGQASSDVIGSAVCRLDFRGGKDMTGEHGCDDPALSLFTPEAPGELNSGWNGKLSGLSITGGWTVKASVDFGCDSFTAATWQGPVDVLFDWQTDAELNDKVQCLEVTTNGESGSLAVFEDGPGSRGIIFDLIEG